MIMSSKDRNAELERNYSAFCSILPNLIRSDPNKYALMRQGNLEHIFTSAGKAYSYALSKYGDSVFSIQQITDKPVDLGFFSHAKVGRDNTE